MDKQLRGDFPAKVPQVPFHNEHPINSAVTQGGFEQGNIASGNLRDHNGSKCTNIGTGK